MTPAKHRQRAKQNSGSTPDHIFDNPGAGFEPSQSTGPNRSLH